MKVLSLLVEKLLWYYDRLPGSIQNTIRFITNFMFTLIYYLGRIKPASKIPLKLLWVDPQEIQSISLETENTDIFTKYFRHGSVQAGEWDKENKLLEEDTMYQFAIDVFINGKNYENTIYYQEVLNKKRELYIRDEPQLRARLDAWKALYLTIKENGFKEQSSLKRGNTLDEICISIDRKGNKILEDGRHRFIIAHILKIKNVPVIINRVHQQFWSTHKSNFV